MAELKYRLLEKGAADGNINVALIFLDKLDIVKSGLTIREACEAVAKDYNGPAAIDVLDMDACTVTSDGILLPFGLIAFASCDYGMINKDFGFMPISEVPYTQELLDEEPHMKQWDILYPGKRVYRGPNLKDRWPRIPHNESQTITGRIANNNTGSEVMDVVEMEEILLIAHCMLEIMKEDGEVIIGLSGPEVSVGIGMIVFETNGRIFNRAYGAGQTGHNSGEYAKTVKSDYPAITSTKRNFAKYTIDALEIGMVPGRDLGCAPAVLAIAKAMGYEIDLDNIVDRAWVELNSVGVTRKWIESPNEILNREQFLDRADELIPGMPGAVKYKVSDIVTYRTIDC
jgi:hypothetical protein